MRLRNEPWSLSKHVFFKTIVKQWYKKNPQKSYFFTLENDSCRRCNSAKVSGASYHNIDSLNIIQMTDRALKNWQQRAAWSNVIWLVAKCVIVASIRARRKRRLSVDVSLVGELMDLQYCLTDFRDLTSCFFFFFFSFKYVFLSFILKVGARAQQSSMKWVKSVWLWLCSRPSKWL